MTVGTSLARIDALSKVTGDAHYPGDLVLPGMAHAKVLFARRPHARVIAIDTSAALAFPGVLAVFTGADVPVNEFGIVLFDAPVTWVRRSHSSSRKPKRLRRRRAN
jgi:CO/xanthine dehydrogenase Mo-binding subunit